MSLKTGTRGVVATVWSGTTGGWLTGSGSIVVVTRAAGTEPSLLVGSTSDVPVVAETTSSRVPLAGAVPVTVKESSAPDAMVPTVHWARVPVMAAAGAVLTFDRAAGRSSVSTTSAASAGPGLVSVIV